MGLHHVQLAMPQGEEEAAVRFYGYMLGPGADLQAAGARAAGEACGSADRTSRCTWASRTGSARRQGAPGVHGQGLEHLLTRIETAGIRVVEDEVQLEGFHRVYVRDPFGNRIELIEPV